MKKNKQGFTLIELLVVIAIIGLLSTLSIVALNQARARSRDARRIADVKQIQTALEMYYNDVSAYPTSTAIVAGQAITNGSTTYMDIIPKPPLPSDGTLCPGSPNVYTYAQFNFNGAIGSSYTLQYCLGASTGGILNGLNTATPSGIAQKGRIQ